MRTEPRFEHISSARRLRSMLRADCRRMFTSGLFYILVGTCLVLPVLILVMTPLDATVLHAGLCLAGGVLFSAGLGVVSTALLRNRDLV